MKPVFLFILRDVAQLLVSLSKKSDTSTYKAYVYKKDEAELIENTKTWIFHSSDDD